MNVSNLARSLGAKWLKKVDPDCEISGFGIDSRVLGKNDCFFAIRGENFDGHSFIKTVHNKASCIVVDRKPRDIAKYMTNILYVRNTRNSLAKIARKIREVKKIKTIAITGSCGKTTTKEMVSHVLSGVLKVNKSPYSFNNDIGVSLTLANPGDVHLNIVEVGISRKGEMSRLSCIIRPDIVCLTSIGHAHVEGFHSIEEIPAEKLKLLDHSVDGAVGIIPKELESYTRERYPEVETVTFGNRDEDCDIWYDTHEYGYELQKITVNGTEIYCRCSGNILSSVLITFAVCMKLGVNINDVLDRFASFRQPPMRNQKIILEDNTLIADCYNSNPTSCKSALMDFSLIPHPTRKLVVLGSMLELGRDSAQYHRDIVEFAHTLGLSNLILIGDSYGLFKGKYPCFETVDDFIVDINWHIMPGDLILLKGSRGASLEKVINYLSGSDHGEEAFIRKNMALEL